MRGHVWTLFERVEGGERGISELTRFAFG
jgi:hypothetical protein